ncbi:MAG: MBL fold metallo-hydrolase [Vicinamibacterales bacterium]
MTATTCFGRSAAMSYTVAVDLEHGAGRLHGHSHQRRRGRGRQRQSAGVSVTQRSLGDGQPCPPPLSMTRTLSGQPRRHCGQDAVRRVAAPSLAGAHPCQHRAHDTRTAHSASSSPPPAPRSRSPPRRPRPPPGAAALAATKIEKVADTLYIITGASPTPRETFSGGNTGVFITDRGVVVVDTKLAGWGPTILERIRTVTDKPVVTIINTHTHGDHTGSNDFFGASVESVVHENTRANMARMEAFKGANAQFLPKRTYRDKLTLGAGKDQIDLYHFGAGHTDGDTFVVYTALRTMQAGDMFPWKDAPFIDRSNGGSGRAWPETLARMLGTVKNVDRVIGGHQPVAAWKDVAVYQQFLADLYARTVAAHKAGRTVEEAAADTGWLSRYPGYGSTRLTAAVQAIYDEVSGK